MAKFYRHTVNGLVPIDSEKADKEYVDGKINNLQNSIDDITDVINVDSSDNKFVITDTNGNIGLKLDENGLSVKDVTAGEHTLSQKADKSEIDKKLDRDEFEDIISISEDNKFVITDTNGNIGLKLDENGLSVKDVIAGEHILSEKADQSEVDKKLDRVEFEDVISIAGDNEFIITDENGNIGFKLDSNSAKAKDFTTSDNVCLSGVNAGLTDAISRLSTIEGLLSEDGNEVIDNIKDVIDYFNGVKETETGAALLSSVASHTSQISNLSNSVNTNTNNITTNTTTIASLSTRVTTNESNISKKLNKTEFTDVINVDGGNNEFVISDENGNIGFKLDSNSANAKDFTTSDDVSLNDVGERLTDVESSIGMESITYNNLSLLRDKKSLIPGRQYRIIDYVTTTTQKNTQSAGHPFDIIVTANSNNTLNEVAMACLHDADTYFSEAGAKLEAWKIWYCLDNDANRFAWADNENGKGVIYRMIDEWGNDCPYDFKNIQFRRLYADGGKLVAKYVEGEVYYDAYFYTFSYASELNSSGNIEKIIDTSIFGNNGSIASGENCAVTENVIGSYSGSDFNPGGSQGGLQRGDYYTLKELNNNVFFNENNDFCGYSFNTLGLECVNNTFCGQCIFISLGLGCSDNAFGNCLYCVFDDYCCSNVVSVGYFVLCGVSCVGNTIVLSFIVELGNLCIANTVGCCSLYIKFGDMCNSNELYDHNLFDPNDYGTSGCIFSDGCSNNIVGRNCSNIKIGDYISELTLPENTINKTYMKIGGGVVDLDYMTIPPSLSSSGNNITVTALGSTSDEFTVPYATNAGSANTANTATTATNLESAPSLAAGTSDTNKIKVTAGGKTSNEFTVPYATNAGTATNATNADKLNVYSLVSTVTGGTYYLTFSNINSPTINSEYGTIYDCPTKFTCNTVSGTISSPIFSASDKINATNGFFETSDERLKDIVNPITVDLDKLSKLRKVYFNWKDNPGSDLQLGMIAQDVQELYPELVSETDGQLSLAYDKLSVVALEAIDVLHNENNELKSRIERLESLVNQLAEKVND